MFGCDCLHHGQAIAGFEKSFLPAQRSFESRAKQEFFNLGMSEKFVDQHEVSDMEGIESPSEETNVRTVEWRR